MGFTKLNEKGLGDSSPAWESTGAQIAEAVWLQVANALSPNDRKRVPWPRYWHLDKNLVVGDQGVVRNDSPLLINLAGRWEERPGELIPPGPLGWDPGDVAPGYCVADRIVLTGNYMKTYTRLTTMEGANESARHAVNAILRDHFQHAERRPQLCDIWPLEERELDDFDFLRELDAKLYERNLDHFLEILDVAEVVGNSLRGTTAAVQDPADPLAILTQLDGIVRKYGTGFLDVIKGDR